MKVAFLILFTVWLGIFNSAAQSTHQLSSSSISFFQSATMGDIDAENVKATSTLNTSSGEVTINIPIKEFHFKKSLMEKHFNEKYIESDKFPTAEFKGKINDISKIDFKSNESYNVTVTGMLTIHGVTKEKIIKATIKPAGNKITADSKFVLVFTDYKINPPTMMWKEVATEVTVTATLVYDIK